MTLRTFPLVAGASLCMLGVWAGCADSEPVGTGGGGTGGEIEVTTGVTGSTASSTASSSASTTSSSSGGGQGGGTGGDNAGGAGGGGQGGSCDTGDGEPDNDLVTGAFRLPELDDDTDPAQLMGVLEDADDEDWYVFHGVDAGGTVTPSFEITSAAMTVCMYFDCDDSQQEAGINCAGGMANDVFPHSGCCWEGTAERSMPNFYCGNSSLDTDNADIYLRVLYDGSGPACEEYTLTYAYRTILD